MTSEIARVSSDRPWIRKVVEGFLTGTPFGWIASDRALKMKYQHSIAESLGSLSRSMRDLKVLEKISSRSVSVQKSPVINLYVAPEDSHSLAPSSDDFYRLAEELGSASKAMTARIERSLDQIRSDLVRSTSESSFEISSAVAQLAMATLNGSSKVAAEIGALSGTIAYQGTSSQEVVLAEIETLNQVEQSCIRDTQELRNNFAVGVLLGKISFIEADAQVAVRQSEFAGFQEALNRQREILWELANQRMASGDSPRDGRDIGIKRAFMNFSAHQAALRALNARVKKNEQSIRLVRAQLDSYRKFLLAHTGIDVREFVAWEAVDVASLDKSESIATLVEDKDWYDGFFLERVKEPEVAISVIHSSDPRLTAISALPLFCILDNWYSSEQDHSELLVRFPPEALKYICSLDGEGHVHVTNLLDFVETVKKRFQRVGWVTAASFTWLKDDSVLGHCAVNIKSSILNLKLAEFAIIHGDTSLANERLEQAGKYDRLYASNDYMLPGCQFMREWREEQLGLVSARIEQMLSEERTHDC